MNQATNKPTRLKLKILFLRPLEITIICTILYAALNILLFTEVPPKGVHVLNLLVATPLILFPIFLLLTFFTILSMNTFPTSLFVALFVAIALISGEIMGLQIGSFFFGNSNDVLCYIIFLIGASFLFYRLKRTMPRPS